MGDIGTERREVEFEPLPEESRPTPRQDTAADPVRPTVPVDAGLEPIRS
jgi:hypothetical protein